MRRSVRAVVRSVEEVALAGTGRTYPVLVTLTYARPDEWSRRHVSAFMDCVRVWASRRRFVIPYVWVAEIQQARWRRTGDAVVHYHVVMWLPRGVMLPMPDKRGWWRHGYAQIAVARKPTGYLMKYASKGDGGSFPRGLRLCGYGGLRGVAREVRYWLCLPGWLIQRAKVFQRVTRLPGGLWVLEQTGELVRSAWEFVRYDSAQGLLHYRRRTEPLVFPASAGVA